MAKHNALGKGLSSLIPENTLENIQQAYIPDLPINKIIPNQYQPRVEMDPSKLVELADSIREHGIIEPLIVTQNSPHEYELIAGERRWRAAKLAGIKTVPVVVKDASPQQMLELAIVENVQREDLNPIEEALAFEYLAKKFDLTHGDIAQKVGYSRPAVANKIRLLQLSDDLKKGLIQGTISEGHARALLGIKHPQAIEIAYKIIIRDGLSVRAAEALVQKLNQTSPKKDTKNSSKPAVSQTIITTQKRFETKLNTKVKIILNSKDKGKIIIPFENDDQLADIAKKLKI